MTMEARQTSLLLMIAVLGSAQTYTRHEFRYKVIRNKCYDPVRNRYFSKGEMVQPHKGQCSGQFCDGTTRDSQTGKLVSKYYNQGCKENTECELRPGNASAPYPQCCPSYECGPEEDKCYLKETDTYYKPGYHIERNKCVLLNCVERISRRSLNKSFNLIILRCSPAQLKPSDRNCWVRRGNRKSPFPACCDQVVCSGDMPT